MASPFKGYLLKAVDTNEIFPEKYIVFESWDTNPNQREEVKAYREDYSRALHRVTANGEMSTIKFKVRDNLHLVDKIKIQDFFYRAESDHKQRNIRIEFWNDDTNSYTEGIFYRPNPKFTIKRHTNDDIIYKEMEIELIQAEAV